VRRDCMWAQGSPEVSGPLLILTGSEDDVAIVGGDKDVVTRRG
jgi:hypothetical protein